LSKIDVLLEPDEDELFLYIEETPPELDPLVFEPVDVVLFVLLVLFELEELFLSVPTTPKPG
jgi:hypothetical protein